MLKNLFEMPVVGKVLLSPWSLRLVRAAGLAVLLVMVAYGWHQHAIPGVKVPDPLMYGNLTTHFFWTLWVMGVVFIALFLGRGWCTVCPLGWLSGLVAKIGLKLPLPAPLRNFVPVTLVLLAVQLSVYFFAIHRYPDYTAVLLALTLLLTVFSGLIFRKQAFCRILCPAGAVFGLYARVAPFQLRVQSAGVCSDCTSKSCISTSGFWQRYSLGRAVLYWHKRRGGCPVDLVPAELEDSSACTLCLSCAENCDKSNIVLGRRPWLADLCGKGLSSSETFFFLVLLGMVTANFSKVYVDLREAIFWIPEQAALLLGWQAPGYSLLAALWVALGVPLLLMLPGFLVHRLSGFSRQSLPADEPPSRADLPPSPPAEAGFLETLGVLALPYIPLLLFAHLVIAVVKVNAKIGYLPYVFMDPSGVKSYLAINVMGTMAPAGLLVPLDTLKWGVLALVAVGYILSLAGARRVAGSMEQKKRKGYLAASAIGLTLAATLYFATVINWLFIR